MTDPVNHLRRLAEELKRRGVVRVGVVYVAVAFVVLEATELVVPLLFLPEEVTRVVLALVLLFLPVALVLGWAYDLTPEGVRRADGRRVWPPTGGGETGPAGTPEGARRDAEGPRYEAGRAPGPWLPRSTALLAGAFLLVALGLWWGADRLDVTARTAAGLGARTPGAAGSSGPARLAIPPPPGTRLTENPFDVAISPDGEVIVFAATDGDSVRFYQRRIDEYEARPIPGAAGTRPFFSPDGRWIAYGARGRLWKVSLVGGRPQPLAEIVTWFGGGTWGEDGSIVYADGQLALFRIADSGGEPERLLGVDTGGANFREPFWLEEGEALLATQGLPGRRTRVILHRLDSGETDVLVEQGYNPRYVPSERLLLYHLDDDLVGARLAPGDPPTLGPTVPLLTGFAQTAGSNGGNIALASNGTLAYLGDPGGRMWGRLAWVDTAGRTEPLPLPSAPLPRYRGMRISPDGDRLVFYQPLETEENVDVWMYEIPSGHLRQLTRGQGNNWWPIWGPDGDWVIHNSDRASADEPGAGLDLYATPLASGGEPRLLAETAGSIQPQSWTPDGRILAFQDNTIDDAMEGEQTLRDIWLLSFGEEGLERGEPERRPFRRTRFDEFHPSFSPDGRWIAYVSDESGEREVYVTDFPETGPPRRVSSGGGVEPIWAPDGSALYYRPPDFPAGVVRVRVDADGAHAPGELRIGEPRSLIDGPFSSHRPWGRNYDLHPDGERFLVVETFREGAETSEWRDLRVVLGWLVEVRERLGTGGG